MSVNFNKNATINTTGLSETLINPFDTEFYYEPDNTVWIKIVHHNNPANVKFASNNTFTTSVYIDADRWFNVALCNLVSKWELMIKQMPTTGGTESKFRWIQKYNPMTATYAQVAATEVTKNTSSGYSSFSDGGLYPINSNTYLCTNNGNQGNWWGSVGAWNAHQGGIPAWNGTVVTTGYMDLYLRVDNISAPNKISIYNNSLLTNEIYEI